MLSVEGTFQNGIAHPTEPVEGRDGQNVIITFLEGNETQPVSPSEGADWKALEKLMEDCTVETGIADLAHEHDHYLYGKRKVE